MGAFHSLCPGFHHTPLTTFCEDRNVANDSPNLSTKGSKGGMVKAWAKRVKGILHLGTGNNLLDHHYETKLNLILDRKVYLRWINKFFTMESLLSAAAWLTCLWSSSLHMDTSAMDYKKEAWGLLLRSGQKYFSEGIEKISDSQICDIRVMSLRLQSNIARNLYGTKYLPVLGADDPMKTQLMRRAHELEHGAGRLMGSSA